MSRAVVLDTGPLGMDAILHGLLNAQAVWLATRDPAALRRKLIELLAALC